MHDNVIIGLVILTAFTLSIMLALYGMRLMDRDRQWRPRRYGISAREVPCSFCGKLVRAEAILCRHCHHRLDENPQAPAGAEATDGEATGVLGAPQAADNRLVAAGATSFVIQNEEFSKNQALAWLDSAFQQLSVRPAPVAFGPAMSEEGLAQEPPSIETTMDAAAPDSDVVGEMARSEAIAKNEVAVRTIGPLSQQPGMEVLRAKSWWTARKEWAVAAGIIVVAMIVGGSSFLVGPMKAPAEQAEKTDDYVTFDVSERAPLYTGPETTLDANGDDKIAEREAGAKPEPTIDAAKPVPMAALPQLPSSPAPASGPATETAAEIPVSLAAIAPPEPTGKGDPASVATAPRPEEWANSVARAIKPTPSKDLVVAVQRLVRAEGYDPGQIDGILGPRTRRAIQQYQRNGGLKQTGDIDRDLLMKLNLADRTVRVVGPMNGISAAAASTPARRTSRPVVEWTK